MCQCIPSFASSIFSGLLLGYVFIVHACELMTSTSEKMEERFDRMWYMPSRWYDSEGFRYLEEHTDECGGIDVANPDKIKHFIRTEISRAIKEERERLRRELKDMRGNLVTNNNDENGAPKNCNPRCHDSGKEDMALRVLALLVSKQEKV